MLRVNDNWVYRVIYDRHILMSIETNEILCISPLVGELFINTENDFSLLYHTWCNKYKVSEPEKIISLLEDKGVIING